LRNDVVEIPWTHRLARIILRNCPTNRETKVSLLLQNYTERA
jgi:hypothetical protein